MERRTGVRLIAAAAVAVWVGRWAALELAAVVARRRPHGPPPLDSPRQPGRMPLPPELP
ncbi:MAG: hypothetical protein ACM33B_08860 [Pseudomonadota bacterium]